MIVSVLMLSLAMKTLPVGTAYAVWTGIGAIGTVIFGIFVFKEPATLPRLIFVAFILVGIIGLKITLKNNEHHYSLRYKQLAILSFEYNCQSAV